MSLLILLERSRNLIGTIAIAAVLTGSSAFAALPQFIGSLDNECSI